METAEREGREGGEDEGRTVTYSERKGRRKDGEKDEGSGGCC